MVNEEATFEVRTRVISKEGGPEGIIARVCSDPAVVFVRWDDSPTQQRMVEVATLNRAKAQ